VRCESSDRCADSTAGAGHDEGAHTFHVGAGVQENLSTTKDTKVHEGKN
jgi:hypothetical protein